MSIAKIYKKYCILNNRNAESNGFYYLLFWCGACGW